MKNKKKLQEGDIFYVQVSGKYVFGRILLDVNERILKLEPQHKYKFYSGCYLAIVYKGIYDEPVLATEEIGLPSQFVFKNYFYSKTHKVDWVFYKHQPVDYTKIDFPELLEGAGPIKKHVNFRKFDALIPLETVSYSDWPGGLRKDGSIDMLNRKYTGSICVTFYQMVDEALHLQGRDDLMRDKERTYFLCNSDLRLSLEYRAKFYSLMDEDPDIPYYELALKHGFDLARFY